MIQNLVRMVLKTFRLLIFELNDSIYLSLVITFVGYPFKIFRMSWYRCITPFLDNLQIVIKIYLFQCHDLFPGFDYN